MRNHPRERSTPLTGYKDDVNTPTSRKRQLDTPSRSQPESTASYYRFSEKHSECRLGESIRLPREQSRKTYRFDESSYDRNLRAEELASRSEEVSSRPRSSQTSRTSRSRELEPLYPPNEASGPPARNSTSNPLNSQRKGDTRDPRHMKQTITSKRTMPMDSIYEEIKSTDLWQGYLEKLKEYLNKTYEVYFKSCKFII